MGGRSGTARGGPRTPASAVGTVARAASAADVPPSVVADARDKLQRSTSPAALRNATRLADSLQSRLTDELAKLPATGRARVDVQAARAALRNAARGGADRGGADRGAVADRLASLQTALEAVRRARPQAPLL